MNTAEFDRFAEEYEQVHAANIAITGEQPAYFHEYKIRVLCEMVVRKRVEVGRILDFGSGIGNSTPYLRRYFPQAGLASADVSQRSLEIAAGRFPGASESLRIEGTQIPVENGAFDLSFSACVFHHIPEEEHVHWLRELRRVTRFGGMMAIFEHNPRNPLTVHAVNTCPLDENAKLLRAEKLADRLRTGGWTDVEVRYHVFFPHALAKLRWLEGHLARVPLGGQYSVSASNT